VAPIQAERFSFLWCTRDPSSENEQKFLLFYFCSNLLFNVAPAASQAGLWLMKKRTRQCLGAKTGLNIELLVFNCIPLIRLSRAPWSLALSVEELSQNLGSSLWISIGWLSPRSWAMFKCSESFLFLSARLLCLLFGLISEVDTTDQGLSEGKRLAHFSAGRSVQRHWSQIRARLRFSSATARLPDDKPRKKRCLVLKKTWIDSSQHDEDNAPHTMCKY
jgi:hypothetical protein